ncbi:MAG: hydrogenase maturation protease [Candidatus Krumholzibacteriota bacterium]
MRATTTIIGMGNPILSDDSVGVRLARDVNLALCDRPDVVVVEECSVGGLNLLDYLEGFEQAVVLDAIHTRGGKPGTCYRFTAADLRETANLCNVHDANFATALALGRSLGMKLPRDSDIHVFAVEIVDDLTFGKGLTPPVARAYPACLHRVLRGLKSLLDASPAPVA